MPASQSTDRIATGIPGFDKLIEGGLVKGSTYLVAGQTGTGKSIFSMQYILNGLLAGEPGIYITLEQGIDELLADMSKFGWDKILKKHIDEKRFLIVSTIPSSIKELQEIIMLNAKKIGAKRLVLDSLSVATMAWKVSTMDTGKVRSEIFDLMRSLENMSLTSILITEVPENSEKEISRFGFEEFIADGIVKLNYIGLGSADFSTLEIRKMRRTAHSRGLFPLVFTKDGLKVGSQSTVAIR